MSHLLWKYYWDNDVDKFRRLLASPASYGGQSPTPSKLRKISGQTAVASVGKTEVNSRDYAGLTILLRASSSVDPNAILFVQALLEHPAVDLYAQDPESGWNALHRALYTGNISIARLLLAKERSFLKGDGPGNALGIGRVGHLIKTKDREGNSPFDLYNSTINGWAVKDKSSSGDDSDADAASSSSGANDGSYWFVSHLSTEACGG